MSTQKVVLAYSGGLDTSVILRWLVEKGFEVIAYIADVGQADHFEEAESKAEKIGASKVYVEDLKEEFVTDFIFPIFSANAVYEGRYLLGTAIARPLIAKRQIEIAARENASYVAHGATGKGNDQVRFELSYYALEPAIQVIAPWKDRAFLQKFKGRNCMLEYAEEKGIPIKTNGKKPFSEDANLLHISHEAGVLEDPGRASDSDVYCWTADPKKAPDEETFIEMEFKDGIPIRVKNLNDGTEKRKPLELFQYLNEIGAKNGVGRLDMVENRFVGIKSRGVYETPGGEILYTAHRDIEGIAMDREVMQLRDTLTAKLSELVYYGFWFSPEMEFLMSAVKKSQEWIDGTVILSVYKGKAMPVARTSPISLYNQDLSSMDIEGGFDQKDSEGFIKINALRLKAHAAIMHKKKKSWTDA